MIRTLFIAAAFLVASTAAAFAAVSQAQAPVSGLITTAQTSYTSPVLAASPAPGDALIIGVGYASAGSNLATPPSGWTQIGTTQSNTNLANSIAIFCKIATNTDTGAATFGFTTATAAASVEYDLAGSNNSCASVAEAFGSATVSNATSLTVTSGTPTQTDYPIAFFDNRTQNSSTLTNFTIDASSTTGYSAVVQAGHGALTSSAASTTATYTASYPVGAIIMVEAAPTATPSPNNLSLAHAGGPHQSVVIALSAPVPSLLPHETYIGFATGGYNSMDHISPANAAKWCDYAQASTNTTTSVTGGDTGGANGSNCNHAYGYTSINMLQATTAGVVNTFPWNGGMTGASCPSAYQASSFAKTTGTDAPNWTSSSPSTNWFMYEVPAGGTYGSDADRVQSFYGTSTYMFFTNLASTALQQSLNDAVANCSTGGKSIDSYYEGFWNDNGYIGLQNNPNYAYVVWWGLGTYDKEINWGIPTEAGPYTGSTCNGGPSNSAFWNGSQCTVGSLIDSNAFTAGNTTYGPDTGTGTNKISTPIQGWQSMMSAIKHANGTLIKWQFNGLLNGYAACDIANAEPNVTGGFDEGATVRGSQDDGRLQLDSTIENVIDTAATLNACGGGATFFLHDYLATENAEYFSGGTLTTVTNGANIGTPVQQEDMRAHFYLQWLLSNDTHPKMMGSMLHACGNTTCKTAYPSWTDVMPENFVVPAGRITPYPAEALGNGQYCSDSSVYDHNGTNQLCTQGGAHDTNICVAGTAPNCLFIATFNHFWVWDYTACSSGPDQTQWASCAKDIGPFTVLYNLSGSAQTLSSTNLSTWIGSSWSSENYMLWPGCQPTTSAYGTMAGQTVYPGDNGGTAANSAPSTTNVCNGSTATDVYYGGRMGSVSKASILGTVLNDGESIGFTAAQP